MSLIRKELEKIDFIVAKYAEDKDVIYQNHTNIITEQLKKLIGKYELKFGLVSVNSVRSIKHYSFLPRVKDPDSLREKLVRNNLFNAFADLLPDGYKVDTPLILKIKKKISDCDDLIGIKILTDLNVDCKKMMELIKSPEFSTDAEANSIKLNEKDLEKQPQPMRNGLDIYKIKGKYDNKFNFELQIKSKIISAWGDMEHSIFYKDYAISPVRDTAEKSMNHVGKLLFQIDDFVESIRNTNKDYKERADALMFLNWFEAQYTDRLKAELNNISFRLNNISDVLYACYTYFSVSEKTAENAFRFDHFEFSSKLFPSYISSRNKSYDLKILEAIVLSWCLKKDELITVENIDNILSKYLDGINTAIAKYLNKEHSGFDVNELSNKIGTLQYIGIKYNCNAQFILDLKRTSKFLKTTYYLKDICESKISDQTVDLLITFIFIVWNKGKVEELIDDCVSGKDASISKEELLTYFVKLDELLITGSDKDKIGIEKILFNLFSHLK